MFRVKHTLTAAVLGSLMLAQSLALPLRPQGSVDKRQDQKPVTTASQSVNTAATTPAPAPAIEKGKTIFIDAGHGGWDAGAVHKSGGQVDLTEEEATLAVALKLAEMLRQDGYHVVLDRDSDAALTPDGSTPAELQARADMANKAHADLFISVHFNASENAERRGTEVYYCADRAYGADNERLAREVQNALVRNLRQAGYDTQDHGIKDDKAAGHFAVLGPANLDRPTTMPAIIGEALYISNDQDAAQIRSETGRDALARGYFEGVKAFFGDNQ